ncbi:MAG: Flp family type IVb pilin [Pirellulaceae bacterium]
MSSSWTQRILRFLENEDGPTTVEYAVLLAMIVGVCIGAVQTMSTATQGSFDTSANAISNAIGS